ncbi:MAG: NAD(+)/NADH kinase [Treponema sp.]|nr:NAD(+)/NADH kinase [Treponema sp.]
MKKCLIVVNTSKPESKEIGQKMHDYLKNKNISSSFYEFDGKSCNENPFVGNDFAVTLGGDGTVLFAARSCAALGIPVFPVNLGEFGFIAGVEKTEWEQSLLKFLSGDALIALRTLAQATFSRNNGYSFFELALNDIVVSAQNAAKTISFEVSYNGTPLGLFKADGVIISTATGSTAYSVSAGGPIIDPALDALVLTPINPFSLSGRPLVLHPSGEIEITIRQSRSGNPIITADGQKPTMLEVGDKIKIMRSPHKVQLVECSTQKFYTALRLKLNWSGGPHARRPYN